MHEIGIVRQIVRTVEDFAAAHDVKRVDAVVVDCGELSLVIPKYLKDIYPALIEGTILEHAELIVEETPGLAECDDCDEIFNVVEHKGYCPSCGSFNKTVLSGKDCTIREIRVAEDK